MRSRHILILLLGLICLAGWGAHYLSGPNAYAGLECADDRITAFGWTNEDKALAEMAAILRWEERARTTRAGAYTLWVHARDRYLTCRDMHGESHHYQCKTSATPCKLAAQS